MPIKQIAVCSICDHEEPLVDGKTQRRFIGITIMGEGAAYDACSEVCAIKAVQRGLDRAKIKEAKENLTNDRRESDAAGTGTDAAETNDS